MARTNYSQHVYGRQRSAGTVDRHTYLQSARSNAKRGQDLPQTKLLDMDIVTIRSAARQRENLRQYIRDNLSNDALAKQFGVSVRAIERVMAYETHGNIV